MDDQGNRRLSMALETIDSEDIHAYIDYMASDALYGRNAGTAGNARTVDWLAARFRKLGLLPGGDDGTFFQSFSFRPRGTSGNRVTVRNVIGVIRGTDPDLKHEAIVIGAHMDHVGREGHDSNPGRFGGWSDDEDQVWNGADDNASGTAGVIEIAQAFSLARLKTKRTLIFVLFNAEEHGLFGSRHYVNNPVHPLEDTIAMINLDMIGRNSSSPVQVIGTETSKDSEMRELARLAADCVPGMELAFDFPSMGGSDHASFIDKRIPSAFFFSGIHRDYHHPTDELEKLNCEQIVKVTKTAMLMTYQLAEQDERITFNPDYRTSGFSFAKKRQLGIEMGKSVSQQEFEGLGLSEEQGAIRVKEVFTDSSASQAGLEEGDLILSLGNTPILRHKSVTCLREAIRSAPKEADIPIEVVRNKEILMLSVRFLE